MAKEELKFPENFLWGTATSAYQIEGGNFNADWYEWEKKGRVERKETAGRASEHYHLYEKDFDLVKGLGQNIHRLSIEWSRIEPEEGKFNQKEIDHYRQVLRALKKRNIKSIVTLHHFTNPLWLARLGAWENKKTPRYFTRYTDFVSRQLGEYVDFWITINEPMIYIDQGYFEGVWPPGKRNQILTGLRVLANMIKAHKLAYKTIHQNQKNAQVGLAKDNQYFDPYRKNFLPDRLTVKFMNYFWNHLFLKKTKGCHDFIGLNYYLHNRLEFRLIKASHLFFNIRNENKSLSDITWEIYPKGIYYLLLDLKKYNLPIYITENGIADSQDKKRVRFIIEHLKYVHQAIQERADVRGYLHWSLIDNFEWDKGYRGKFGLAKVDFKTQERILRPSAEIYAHICKENRLLL